MALRRSFFKYKNQMQKISLYCPFNGNIEQRRPIAVFLLSDCFLWRDEMQRRTQQEEVSSFQIQRLHPRQLHLSTTFIQKCKSCTCLQHQYYCTFLLLNMYKFTNYRGTQIFAKFADKKKLSRNMGAVLHFVGKMSQDFNIFTTSLLSIYYSIS